ncbi:Lrp/AsnC family transcriptional regulator [Pacificimonas sp. WHA3]|uniref:Lrp/AsnC family transcriptional regulator n=1 Tax=Pacificimonas pallii TaxID=2827236 RepID=A0ABS6SF01_9SPHN|nr:Lrp/AsnC family transcriptional regulator [Pacificimonas pallii]MBV7256985.1 Lrp/AsnC family transcriptional regulator [Pacificimonas pallii]
MDKIDQRILTLLQKDATLTIAQIAEQAGISSTPAWRRIRKMEEDGVIDRRVTILNPEKLNLGLTGFVLIRTSDHSDQWLKDFAAAVSQVPEVVEAYRTTGDVDYILKIVAPDVAGYDQIYKRLIAAARMNDVSASFSMERLKDTTELPLTYAAG